MSCEGADWPLSRKFGCAPEMAVELLRQARELGLDPYGVSFHVGSQQTDLSQWDHAIGAVARMFTLLAETDINLRMVNIGGGFPAQYRGEVAGDRALMRQAVTDALTRHFGNHLPEIIVEPGRSLVGDAGADPERGRADLATRATAATSAGSISMSASSTGWPRRWARASSTASRRRAVAGRPVPVILAGPTCDSADILYEHTEYRLPLDLAVGDKVEILSTGAYTASYASVGFNGFPPLRTYCI